MFFKQIFGICLLALTFSLSQAWTFLEPSVNAGEGFANSVWVDGNLVAAGAPGHNMGMGAVFIYTCTPTSCTPFQQINGTVPGGSFGTTVGFGNGKLAISSGDPNTPGGLWVYECDPNTQCTLYNNMPLSLPSSFSSWPTVNGNWIAVGAPAAFNDTGAVYVFSCDATTMTCNPFATNPLIANNPLYRSGLGFQIDFQGSMLVSGSWVTNGVGGFFAWSCSAANGGQCLPFQNNPYSPPNAPPDFGSYLAIAGSTLYVTAPSYNNAGLPGTIYVYTCQAMDCHEVSTFSSPNPQNGEQFGDFTVFADGKYFLTGAQNKDNGKGVGYVYTMKNGQVTLVGAYADPLAIAAFPGFPGEFFGWAAEPLGTDYLLWSSPYAYLNKGALEILPIFPDVTVNLGVRWGSFGKVYATFQGTLGSKTVLLSPNGFAQGSQSATVSGLKIGDITSITIGTFSQDRLALASLTVSKGGVTKYGTLTSPNSVTSKGMTVTFALNF